jgi:hypothetical protein
MNIQLICNVKINLEPSELNAINTTKKILERIEEIINSVEDASFIDFLNEYYDNDIIELLDDFQQDDRLERRIKEYLWKG